MAAKKNYSVTPFILRWPVQMARLLLTPLPADTFGQSRDQLNIYVTDDVQEGKYNINDIFNSQGYLESSNRWAAFERLIHPAVEMERFLGEFGTMINSRKHLRATKQKANDVTPDGTYEEDDSFLKEMADRNKVKILNTYIDRLCSSEYVTAIPYASTSEKPQQDKQCAGLQLNSFLPIVADQNHESAEDVPVGLLKRIWIPRVVTTEQIEAADPPETRLDDWIGFTPEYKKQVSVLAKQSARIERVLSGHTGHVPLYVTLAVKPVFSDHIKAGDYIFLRNKMLKLLHNGKGFVSETEYAWVTRNDRMRGYNTHLFLSDARMLHFIRAQWMKLTDGQGICCEMDIIDLKNKKAVEWIGYAFRYLAPIFRQRDDSLKGVRCYGHNTAV